MSVRVGVRMCFREKQKKKKRGGEREREATTAEKKKPEGATQVGYARTASHRKMNTDLRVMTQWQVE